MDKRLFFPPNGLRPTRGDCAQSEQSTAVPLLDNGGEYLIIGGCPNSGEVLQQADIYNFQADTWRSFSMGIRRGVGSSILLLNGNVIVLSGENGEIDQNMREFVDASADPRYVQIIDPSLMLVYTETVRSQTFRGYHNTADLLPDGSILLGGGFNQRGDVGCEEPNLQTFSPSYLSLGPRPSLSVESTEMPRSFSAPSLVLYPGQSNVKLALSDDVKLDAKLGVCLLAVQAFTHSFG
jgi:hypothetical protein